MEQHIDGIRLKTTSPDPEEAAKQNAEEKRLYHWANFYTTGAMLIGTSMSIGLIIIYLKLTFFSQTEDRLVIGLLAFQAVVASATTWLFTYPVTDARKNIRKMNLYLTGTALALALAYAVPYWVCGVCRSFCWGC